MSESLEDDLKFLKAWNGEICLCLIRGEKPNRDAWCKHRWPLVEMRMSRQHCLDWMEAKGFPVPPRSACVFCPFHDAKEWRRMQLSEPAEFERAVQAAKSATKENFNSIPCLHRSCKPLDTIDFRSDVEHGQGLLWQDECTGMCGN